MTAMTPRELLNAFDEGLEIASSWPRLLTALGFDPDQGRPGPLLLNNALEQRGYRRVLDESDSFKMLTDAAYPDSWWRAVAREVAGRDNATVDDVVSRLRLPAKVASLLQ